MSHSDAEERVPLRVETPDPAAEIFVIDDRFRLAERGVGRLDTALRPGIYKVQVRAASEIQEQHAILRSAATPITKTFESLPFVSPAPLIGTAKTHEYHMEAAATESRTVRIRAGEGSWIFVFARDWTGGVDAGDRAGVNRRPARGLALLNAAGEEVVDIVGQAVTRRKRGEPDPWAACNVQVDPGLYRLRLTTPTGVTLEQTIVASPTWQSQVFLLQRNYGEKATSRCADLGGGSILLGHGPGFNPSEPSLRVVELARMGLANRRKVLSDEIREMLKGKFDNPMLGIFAGHLLLREPEPDLALLEMVVQNLRNLLEMPHPDVEALALRLGSRAGSYRFTLPPMVQRSWKLVVEATAEQPDLVPHRSLASEVSTRLWEGEPWMLWFGSADGEANEGDELAREALERALKPYQSAGVSRAETADQAPQQRTTRPRRRKQPPAHAAGDLPLGQADSWPRDAGGEDEGPLAAEAIASGDEAPISDSAEERSPAGREEASPGEPLDDTWGAGSRPQLDEQARNDLVRTLGLPRARIDDLLNQRS